MTFCYVFSGGNIVILAFLYIFNFLFCHGNIESNTGPTRSKPNYLSLCQISATYHILTYNTPLNDNSLEIKAIIQYKWIIQAK